MKIDIYIIAKPSKDEFEVLINNFLKMSLKFAKVNIHYIFNKTITKAQAVSKEEAKKAYSEAYLPYIANGYNIALDVLGKKLDSYKFASLIDNKNQINFFIGGAFGFQREFLKKCDSIISLSDLTMAHKVANLMLCEQIFRALCINNNHPYHK